MNAFFCRRFLSMPIVMLFLFCTGSNPVTYGALTTRTVATGLESPVYVTAAPADTTRLFIVEQTGKIKILKSGLILSQPFLDLSSDISCCGEQGLLGLAFHPDYANNGFFFVYFTASGGGSAGRVRIVRYEVSSNADRADPASAVSVLDIDQPFANHNGGMIAFSPNDGYLYIGLGDGGAAGDPSNNAQTAASMLGKMLRINVDSSASGENYAIPPSNPFAGAVDTLPEIWAFGVRNPWRWSFDRETGDMYIADVGQANIEELDFQPSSSTGGENYGWRCKEGTNRYNFAGDCDSYNLIDPFTQYAHTNNRASITGGYVYRGSAIPGLIGTYFYADFNSGEIFSLRYDGAAVTDSTDRTSELTLGTILISSFGEDANGELYIVEYAFGASGKVHKIISTGEPSKNQPRQLLQN